MVFDSVLTRLARIEEADSRRVQQSYNVGTGRYLHRANRRWLNFASNDYLGLATHPRVVRTLQDAVQQYGVGSGASALVTGHHKLHQQLIDKLCEFTGKQDVVLFNSGFTANAGILEALLEKGDLLVQDKLNHASLIDAGRHSHAIFRRFRHNDVGSLAQQLQADARNRLVVTESVFSMDGDCAPIERISQIARAHQAGVMVDDAHGLGVIGPAGKGALHAYHANSIDIYMATCGKALGVAGAFVACDKPVAELIRQTSRHYIYTTAMPPSQAAAISAALDVLITETEHTERLQSRIQLFRKLARENALELVASETAIQPLILGSNQQLLRVSDKLEQMGIHVGAIRPPTVPEGSARLRITLSAKHEEQDIAFCVEHIAEVLEQNHARNAR